MAFQIFLLFIIISLLGYIIYLHIRLAKKNIYIESTLKKYSGLRKGMSSEDILSLIRGMDSTGINKPLFSDRLFDEKPLDFLMGDLQEEKIFIHYTRYEADAKNIIKEGFMFSDSFYKTALPVTDDRLDLLIKHNSKKTFGDFLVILAVSARLFDLYYSEIRNRGLKEVSVENVLTESPPAHKESSDMVYIFSNKFVKGYINHLTGEITRNPEFDPSYDSPAFRMNLERFQKRV
ncbi:MAG: hypothetical protein JXR66_02205 [Bacteroidales bacterium]|nr:hypothetical protein [Bacteroidales bacterium]MBN2632338.1 hypothetical protein [Bacteroidales bacterium]